MKRRCNQPPRHVHANVNVVMTPHVRSYEEIQRDLVRLLEAAVKRNPDIWKPPYKFTQVTE